MLLLLIATVLLVWNMNKRIKNLPASFDEENPEADQLADEGTDRSGVEAGPGSDQGPDAGRGTGSSPSQEPEDDGGRPAGPVGS